MITTTLAEETEGQTTVHLSLMMTSDLVVVTSVIATDISKFRDFSHPDHQTARPNDTPGFRPFA